jgi:alkylation response protein AidB-like acyl-CoA dehydrogenase
MNKSEPVKNRVLKGNYRPSENFFKSDLILQQLLEKQLSPDGMKYMRDKLIKQGMESSRHMNELSMLADKHGPELVKRNALGETINEIRFHPAYWELMKIAQTSEMLHVKWAPHLRQQFQKERHRMGFSSGFLYAMSESGIYCPLCMTDGVARLIDSFCEEDDKLRLLPAIYSKELDPFFTGAMFLTEKAGGSDVGANLVQAKQLEGKLYLLNGEKWFCSNANADIIFVLARTDDKILGTKGLSIFLVEKFLKDGSRNPMDIVRLKDKLGVKSMASAECILNNTVGKLIGNEFEGFKIMAEMMNLSRIYNSMAAIAAARHAMIEAFQFLCHRQSFGKLAIEHPLVRTKFEELQALYLSNFYMCWRAITALDNADNGNTDEAALLRLLTPMIKKYSAESGVYLVRESMELMGGIGYIEDLVIPKIMRDVMVLPIWEGAGNIMILDMLRALVKSDGFKVMCNEIRMAIIMKSDYSTWLQTELELLIKFSSELPDLEKDTQEASAGIFFQRLTSLYSNALLLMALNENTKKWIIPALDYFIKQHQLRDTLTRKPMETEKLKDMIGWI